MDRMQITIRTENEAFSDNPSAELARILRKLAECIENGATPDFLYDINGNKVGSVDTFGGDS